MNIQRDKILEFDTLSADKVGISITKNWEVATDRKHDIFHPHRDKQYILVIGIRGTFKIMIDFKELIIKAPFTLVILPEQVHQLIEFENSEVFNIDFVSSLISSELQGLLHKNFINNNVISENISLHQQITSISHLIYQIYNTAENNYHNYSIHALLLSILNLIAGASFPSAHHTIKENRTAVIEQQFNWLLKNNYIQWKKPSQYATSLAISVSHLNDSVREITGSSVSEHIQQHVVLEAKRLLFFSKKNVKEVGYDLGFEDPVYFNKLFKKIAGITPLQFRLKFRDSYN